MIQTIVTAPIAGQKPGTSGLRKKIRIFPQKGLSGKLCPKHLELHWRDLRAKGACAGGRWARPLTPKRCRSFFEIWPPPQLRCREGDRGAKRAPLDT